jgi:hypothetical protein
VPASRAAAEFVAGIAHPQRRADSLRLLELMRSSTGVERVLWGSSVIGYGTHQYHYETGREGDTVAIGFAPRAQSLVLYGLHNEDAKPLGNHVTGKGCLYVKRLSDVDLGVLERMIKTGFAARHNV